MSSRSPNSWSFGSAIYSLVTGIPVSTSICKYILGDLNLFSSIFCLDVSDLNSTGGPASSVKRNTSFTKKLRTGAIHSQLDALISELSTLRLDKYLSEVVNAMVESKVHSSKDLHACVRIGYLLHERYAEFKDLMTSTLIKILTAPPTSSSGCAAQLKKEKETSRLLRQRTALGLLVEFYLIGIVIDPSKDYIIANMLKTLVYSAFL